MDIEYQEEESFDLWDEEEPEDDLPGSPGWRRGAMVVVAVITALSLAAVPLYNVFGRTPPVSDSGLEICRFDYCMIQERLIDAGLVVVMSRLSTTFLNETEAVALADDIAGFLGVDPVSLIVVDRLEGRLGGVYQPDTRTILIQRPARAWIVAHEMAHVVSAGHGEEFVETLIEISRWLDDTGLPGRG